MAEEAPEYDTKELDNAEKWVHRHPIIYKGGRCDQIPTPNLSEEAAAKEQEDYDAEKVDRFKAVQDDKPYPGLEQAWVFRVSGDAQEYKTGGEKNKTYAVNVIKSLRWPGAVTVAKGGAYCCIYVGDGTKKGDTSINPTEPPVVQADPGTREEEPEPTPLNEPEAPVEPGTPKSGGSGGD